MGNCRQYFAVISLCSKSYVTLRCFLNIMWKCKCLFFLQSLGSMATFDSRKMNLSLLVFLWQHIETVLTHLQQFVEFLQFCSGIWLFWRDYLTLSPKVSWLSQQWSYDPLDKSPRTLLERVKWLFSGNMIIWARVLSLFVTESMCTLAAQWLYSRKRVCLKRVIYVGSPDLQKE